MPDILSVLKAIHSLQAFLASDKVLELFAAVELRAARQALTDARHARDSKAQVWSVVGHLESALQSVILEMLACNTSAAGAFRQFIIPGGAAGRHRTLATGRYILCLMAACYRYLDEPELVEQTMRRALQEHYYNETDMSTGASFVVSMGLPVIIFGLLQGVFIKEENYFSVEDAQAVFDVLNNTR